METIKIAALRRGAIYFACILIALFLQNEILSHLKIFGMRCFFMPLIAVAIGMFDGGLWGGIMGMLTGIVTDFSFYESTVTFTIAFTIIGFFSGAMERFYVNRKLFSYLIVCATAMIFTGASQMLRLLVFQTTDLWSGLFAVLKQMLVSLPYAVPIYFGLEQLQQKLKTLE